MSENEEVGKSKKVSRRQFLKKAGKTAAAGVIATSTIGALANPSGVQRLAKAIAGRFPQHAIAFDVNCSAVALFDCAELSVSCGGMGYFECWASKDDGAYGCTDRTFYCTQFECRDDFNCHGAHDGYPSFFHCNESGGGYFRCVPTSIYDGHHE